MMLIVNVFVFTLKQMQYDVESFVIQREQETDTDSQKQWFDSLVQWFDFQVS